MDLADMQKWVKEYNKSVHYYSEKCDDLIQSNAGLEKNVEELSSKVSVISSVCHLFECHLVHVYKTQAMIGKKYCNDKASP